MQWCTGEKLLHSYVYSRTKIAITQQSFAKILDTQTTLIQKY